MNIKSFLQITAFATGAFLATETRAQTIWWKVELNTTLKSKIDTISYIWSEDVIQLWESGSFYSWIRLQARWWYRANPKNYDVQDKEELKLFVHSVYLQLQKFNQNLKDKEVWDLIYIPNILLTNPHKPFLWKKEENIPSKVVKKEEKQNTWEEDICRIWFGYRKY